MPHSGFGRTSTPLQRKLGRVWWIGIPRLEEFYLGDSGGQDKWEDTWGYCTFHHLPLVVVSSWWCREAASFHEALFDKPQRRQPVSNRLIGAFAAVKQFVGSFLSISISSEAIRHKTHHVWLILAASIQPWNGNIDSFHGFLWLFDTNPSVSDSFERRQSMMLCHIQDSKAIVLPRFWTFESTFRSAPDRPKLSEYYAAVFIRFAWA